MQKIDKDWLVHMKSQFILPEAISTLQALGFPIEQVTRYVSWSKYAEVDIWSPETLELALHQACSLKLFRLLVFCVAQDTRWFSKNMVNNVHCVGIYIETQLETVKLTFIDPTGAEPCEELSSLLTKLNVDFPNKKTRKSDVSYAKYALQWTTPSMIGDYYSQGDNSNDSGVLFGLAAFLIFSRFGIPSVRVSEKDSIELGKILRAYIQPSNQESYDSLWKVVQFILVSSQPLQEHEYEDMDGIKRQILFASEEESKRIQMKKEEESLSVKPLYLTMMKSILIPSNEIEQKNVGRTELSMDVEFDSANPKDTDMNKTTTIIAPTKYLYEINKQSKKLRNEEIPVSNVHLDWRKRPGRQMAIPKPTTGPFCVRIQNMTTNRYQDFPLTARYATLGTLRKRIAWCKVDSDVDKVWMQFSKTSSWILVKNWPDVTFQWLLHNTDDGTDLVILRIEWVGKLTEL